MENIKLGDLYLSKKESTNIIEFLAKMRNIKNYKSKSNDSLYKIFKRQSKNKETIDNIRETSKNVLYHISRKESKDITSALYNIEKTKKIISKKLVNI